MVHREVRFAAVAQEVGERLVDQQLAALREAHRVHETFTELSLSEAGPERILEAAQQLAGASVVLEDDQHRVVDLRTGPGDAAFIADWEQRSRQVRLDGRTTWDEGQGWLVTQVGRRERGWGRLVIGAQEPPGERLIAVAERAAASLAMHRLHDRQRRGHLRRVHHELLVGLLADPTNPDLRRRFALAGFPVGEAVVGVALRPAGAERPGRVADPLGPHEEVGTELARIAGAARLPVVVATVEDEVRALLAMGDAKDPEAVVDELVGRLRARHPVLAAAGPVHPSFTTADRALREAHQVLRSVRPGSRAVVHRLHDTHVRGLLALLEDDDRLRTFAQRELGALHERDAQSGSSLVDTLRALLSTGNKAAAAQALRVSRPVLYDRLARIERLLGVDLGDAETRTSLHLALLAEDLHAGR